MKSIEKMIEEPLLVATIEGPEVRSGHVEAEHLARVLEVLQKSLRSFATQLLRTHGSRISQQQRALAKKYTTLEVTGFASGSFSISLTLPEARRTQDDHLVETGRQALKAMVSGLRLVARTEDSRRDVNGTVAKSLAPFAKMVPLLQNGIKRIRLSLPGDIGLSAVLDENVCRSLGSLSPHEESAYFRVASNPSVPDPSVSQKLTAAALLRSPLVGIWSNRTDITDSPQFARELRDKAGTRQR